MTIRQQIGETGLYLILGVDAFMFVSLILGWLAELLIFRKRQTVEEWGAFITLAILVLISQAFLIPVGVQFARLTWGG